MGRTSSRLVRLYSDAPCTRLLLLTGMITKERPILPTVRLMESRPVIRRSLVVTQNDNRETPYIPQHVHYSHAQKSSVGRTQTIDPIRTTALFLIIGRGRHVDLQGAPLLPLHVITPSLCPISYIRFSCYYTIGKVIHMVKRRFEKKNPYFYAQIHVFIALCPIISNCNNVRLLMSDKIHYASPIMVILPQNTILLVIFDKNT